MKRGRLGRLVAFECRKAFQNPWIPLFLIVLLLLDAWKLLDTCHRKTAPWQDYEAQYAETYEAYRGTITADKVTALMAVYAPLEEKYNAWLLDYTYDPEAYTHSEGLDEEFYRTLFVAEMKYDYFYQNEAYRISSRAKELSLWYSRIGNTYEAAKNRQIAADFEGRRIPVFSDTRSYEVLLSYDFSAMLVLLLIIFSLCGMFVCERETDMDMLLRTTRYGTSATAAAKLIASWGYTVSVCALFFSLDFLIVYAAGRHNEALLSPVYSLCLLEATPLRMSVGMYFLWAALLKTAGALACAAVILLLSSLLRQTLQVFLAATAVFLGFAILQEYTPGLWQWKWFNPIELLTVRDLVSTDGFVNLFSVPVRAVSFIFMGVSLTACLAVCGILHIQRRSRHAAL